MTNPRKVILTTIVSTLFMISLTGIAAAQGSYDPWGRDRDRDYERNRDRNRDYEDDYYRRGRYDERYLRDTVRQLDRSSKNFADDLDRALDHNRSNGTRYEDHINEDAREFRRAVQRLKDRVGDGRNLNRSRSEAETVLETAGHVQRESRRFLNDYRLSSEWSQIRQQLELIADAYDLSWAVFDDGNSRRDNSYPRTRDDERRRRRNNDWLRRIPLPY